MISLEECTWHESHVVWHFPPSACVHVTHGTWNMDHESERKFPLTWIKPRNSLGEKKRIRWREGKEKKGKKKEWKGEKENKGEKRKEKKKEKKGEENKREGKKICVWERRKKGERKKMAPILDVPTVGSR